MRFLKNLGAAVSGVLILAGAIGVMVWLATLAAKVVP
jgi:hypothetical protein